MRKKRQPDREEQPENHERWLVSYADFITLMFAFFVVMYAISTVNEGKYRALSESLINAFKSNTSNSMNSVKAAASNFSPIIIDQPIKVESADTVDEKKDLDLKRQEIMQNMANDVLEALRPLVEDGEVSITQSTRGIAVEINASVLFSPGQAALTEKSIITMRAVAQVLKNHDHEIHIEGHTDNIPIHTASFPSNWELSTARASSVIRLFVENSVAAHRLTALGYGENRPIATNETPEGRKRNRRVILMILSAEPDDVTEIPLS